MLAGRVYRELNLFGTHTPGARRDSSLAIQGIDAADDSSLSIDESLSKQEPTGFRAPYQNNQTGFYASIKGEIIQHIGGYPITETS